MSRSSWGWLVLIGALASSEASGAELEYRWEKGRTYRFEVTSDDTMRTKGMGVDMSDQFQIGANFALTVNKLKPDGTADGILFIERFDIKAGDGRSVAALSELPASALSNKVEVDPKGRFKFKEDIYLLVDDEGETMLVSASANPTGHTATARAGGEEVTVWASFDPKTGRLSGGATVKQLGKKKKKVKVEQDKARVDLVPRQFMELLRLPDGPITAGGGKTRIDTAGLAADLEMTAEVLSQTAAGLQLRTTMKSKTKAAPAKPRDEPAEDEGELGGLPGMTGVPGMTGLPGMGGDPSTGDASATSLELDATADLDMDTKAGMLRSVKGEIKSKSSVSGMMSMENSSKILLKLL